MMPHLQGYDEWLTPERLLVEESQWGTTTFQRLGNFINAEILAKVISSYHIRSNVVEYGCGTGWVPWLLRNHFHILDPGGYIGVDRNPLCIKLCQYKNPHDKWVIGDIEDFNALSFLACSFSVLKHIHLGKWQRVWQHILLTAPIVIATLTLSRDEPKDTGTEHVHTYVPASWAYDLITKCGKSIVDIYPLGSTQDGREEIIVAIDGSYLRANSLS